MTREQFNCIRIHYERLAALGLERIQRMYEGWLKDKETAQLPENAKDLTDLMFFLAMEKAKERDLA